MTKILLRKIREKVMRGKVNGDWSCSQKTQMPDEFILN